MAMTNRVGLLVVLFSLTISATAQSEGANAGSAATTSQGPQAPFYRPPSVQNPQKLSHPMIPDIVCFGYYPNWSVQFLNGEARYLGINQPDKYFRGSFYWVPDEKTWEWHRQDARTRVGQYSLSANVQELACTDTVKNKKYPYTGQIYLPQGDMVSGCCRKLLPGEAPVGPHGVSPNQPKPSVPPATAKAQPAAKPPANAPNNTPKAGIPQNVQQPE